MEKVEHVKQTSELLKGTGRHFSFHLTGFFVLTSLMRVETICAPPGEFLSQTGDTGVFPLGWVGCWMKPVGSPLCSRTAALEEVEPSTSLAKTFIFPSNQWPLTSKCPGRSALLYCGCRAVVWFLQCSGLFTSLDTTNYHDDGWMRTFMATTWGSHRCNRTRSFSASSYSNMVESHFKSVWLLCLGGCCK